jgi:5-(carboxyamino)imidazole ribonucleotide synthase
MKQPVIGIIGGGQLGRMFIEEALRYNVKCVIVDADKNCPASTIAHEQIVGSISAAEPILALASKVDILTYEIEHIFIEPLLQLEKEGKKLIPSPRILQIVQDKGLQKGFYKKNNIPTAPFAVVQKKEEWMPVLKKLNFKKFAAKLCREGYDGRGVQLMSTNEIENDISKIPFDSPTVLEEFIENEKELSIIVARDSTGDVKCFPPVEMEFDPKANLVTFLFCPANISDSIKKEAEQIAISVVEKMNGVGLFAIEMLLGKNGKLYVNEMAPRPHNSGHHTIEACYTSQYEQLLRILINLPLGDTSLIQPAAMLNILGAKDFSGNYFPEGQNDILKIPGVYIHLYGKTESRPMRKLGHITVMAPTLKEVKEKANFVRNHFSIKKSAS